MSTGRSTTITYTHDAWNRLVGVQYGQTVRGAYVYNGLNWRILKQADTDGTGGPDQQRLMHYSAGWQLLEEDVWDDWTEQTPGDIDRHVQYVWGIRYIDDIILRREDRDADGDYDLETDDIARYYLTDAQFTPVAIIDDGADVIERISYMPYGHARHHRMADLDGDGKTNTPDQLLLLGNWGNFGVGDLDRSGAVGSADLLDLNGDWNATAEPAGQISYDSEDNQIGYCGYVFNRETQDYTVRNRHYSPDLGRWLERDPVGFAGFYWLGVAGDNSDQAVRRRGVDTTDSVAFPSYRSEVLRQRARYASASQHEGDTGDPMTPRVGPANLYTYVKSEPIALTDPTGFGEIQIRDRPGRWYLGDVINDVHKSVCGWYCPKGGRKMKLSCWGYGGTGRMVLPPEGVYAWIWLGFDWITYNGPTDLIFEGMIVPDLNEQASPVIKRKRIRDEIVEKWVKYMQNTRQGTTDVYDISDFNCDRYARAEYFAAPYSAY